MDGVVDEHEVSRLVPVAVDDRLVAREHPLSQCAHHAAAVLALLAWPVHVAQHQGGEVDPPVSLVEAKVVLAEPPGHAARRERA